MVFAIHLHESAMGVHVSSILNPASHITPHPILQGCPSARALSALMILKEIIITLQQKKFERYTCTHMHIHSVVSCRYKGILESP